MPLPQHVLGSYGQVLRAGPFFLTDGTPRNMSALTITCERFDRTGAAEGSPSPGSGTTDGYIEYRVAPGNFGSVGIWTYRLYADDADERIVSVLGQIRVVTPSGL